MNSVPKRSYLVLSRAVIFILITAIFLGGCQPLRKKFTRKKKAEDITQETPVLEPIAYPEKIYSPEELYKQHLSLFRVWYKELIVSFDESKVSRKRQLYLLSQAVIQLEEMKKLIAKEKQSVLISVLEDLAKVKIDLESLVSSRSNTSLQAKLRSIEKKILREYALKNVKESLKSSF